MDESKRIVELLEGLLKHSLSPILEREFQDPKKKKLFELTGKFKMTEIQTKLKMSSKTISKIWNEWEIKGIVKKEGQTYKKLFE